jgi:hypothetical protein
VKQPKGKYMKKIKKSLLIILLLTTIMLAPTSLAAAKRKTEVLIEIKDPPTVTLWEEIAMPNGFTRLEASLVFTWYYNDVAVGECTQYVHGIIKYREGKDPVATLSGYGVYEASGDYTGTMTYTIGNQWNMNSGEIWAFRMRIVGGTGDFEGIKGTGGDDAYPHFMLYLNFNPWD